MSSWIAACGGGAGDNSSQLSNDASLSSLALSSGSLDQPFQSSQLAYSVDSGFLSASVSVNATTTNANASIRVNGIAVTSGIATPAIELLAGSNSITIEVTAENGSDSQTYSLVVTRESIGSFVQQAYVKASNTDAGDQFGWRVALSGDTLAVGAYGEASDADGVESSEQANNDEAFAGAVYVFTRSAGIWSQQAYIKASSSEGIDRFGYSLALSGDTLAVGAYGEASNGVGVNSGAETNNDAAESGAVYIFTRSSGSWSQQAYIKASNSEAGDRFGYSLALSGDSLAVGAWGEDSSGQGVNSATQASIGAADSGAVYLFTRSNGDWSQQAYVKASNSEPDDYFGFAVALSEDELAVGAWGEDSIGTGVNSNSESSNSRPGSGAVYVFARSLGSWTQQAYLKASNTDADDLFGYSLALSRDTLAVGARGEDSDGQGVNSATQASVAAADSGAVYVFTRVAGLWSQQAYVKASNSENADNFGHSLALLGDTLAVGARGEDSSGQGVNSATQASLGATDAGAVYLFTRAAGLWSQQAYIKASNSDANDQFGYSLAVSSDTLAVGAWGEDSNGEGVNTATQGSIDALDSGAVYLLR